MKSVMKNLIVLVCATVALSSCATMFGGSRYYATFEVEGHQEAQVKVRGYGKVQQGEKVKLRRHGKKTVTVTESGCNEMTRSYSNTINYTTLANIPFVLVIGGGIDAASGAMFTPQTGEEVFKKKNKHFEYVITGYDEACTAESASDEVATNR